jgi:hypothetical protein
MTDYQDAGPQERSALKDGTSRLVSGFSRLLDAVEPQIVRAPANLQPAARKAVAIARERPLLTMAGLALGALMLTRSPRRR